MERGMLRHRLHNLRCDDKVLRMLYAPLTCQTGAAKRSSPSEKAQVFGNFYALVMEACPQRDPALAPRTSPPPPPQRSPVKNCPRQFDRAAASVIEATGSSDWSETVARP